MIRFAKNHWWALALTLALCLAFNASTPGLIRADSPSEITDGQPGPWNGDPDLPTAGKTPAGKQTAGRGALMRDGRGAQMRSVGDGRINGVWVWRFQVMVRNLRSMYYRF